MGLQLKPKAEAQAEPHLGGGLKGWFSDCGILGWLEQTTHTARPQHKVRPSLIPVLLPQC